MLLSLLLFKIKLFRDLENSYLEYIQGQRSKKKKKKEKGKHTKKIVTKTSRQSYFILLILMTLSSSLKSTLLRFIICGQVP